MLFRSAIKLIVDTDYAKFDSGMAHIEAKIKQVQQASFAYGGLMSGTSAIDRAATARFDQEQAARDRKARQLWEERRQGRVSAWRAQTETMRQSGGVSAASFSSSGAPMYRGMSAARGIGGAAAPMFISAARDTAASLASGANPFTVMLQQGPQVLQAFTMMGVRLSALLPILGKVGLALAAAFSVHIISKGIAGMVYGLDKLDREGEKLKSKATIFRKLREEMEEAAKAAKEWADAMNDVKADYVSSLSSKHKSDLDAYKLQLEREDIEQRKQGGTGRGAAGIESMVRERAIKYAEEDLANLKANAATDTRTAAMEERLERLKNKLFNDKTTKDIEETLFLEDAIPKSKAAFAAEQQSKIKEAENEVTRLKNERDNWSSYAPPSSESAQASSGSKGPLTSAQMSGRDIIGPTFSLVDIQKKHLSIADKTLTEMIKLNQSRGHGLGAYFGQ